MGKSLRTFSIAITFLSLGIHPFSHGLKHSLRQHAVAYSVDDRPNMGLDDNRLSAFIVEAAAHEIKQRILVNLPALEA